MKEENHFLIFFTNVNLSLSIVLYSHSKISVSFLKDQIIKLRQSLLEKNAYKKYLVNFNWLNFDIILIVEIISRIFKQVGDHNISSDQWCFNTSAFKYFLMCFLFWSKKMWTYFTSSVSMQHTRENVYTFFRNILL